MRREALEYLIRSKQICGEQIDERFVCLLAPGHFVPHSSEWPQDPLTHEQRLERELAKLKAQRDSRTRRTQHLINRIQALEQRRSWTERYIGFRVEYRIRGAARRMRRYWRIVWHRTGARVLGTWPPS